MVPRFSVVFWGNCPKIMNWPKLARVSFCSRWKPIRRLSVFGLQPNRTEHWTIFFHWCCAKFVFFGIYFCYYNFNITKKFQKSSIFNSFKRTIPYMSVFNLSYQKNNIQNFKIYVPWYRTSKWHFSYKNQKSSFFWIFSQNGQRKVFSQQTKTNSSVLSVMSLFGCNFWASLRRSSSTWN